MTGFEIIAGNPRESDVAELLRAHLQFAREWSLPENVKVLGADALASDDVDFLVARREGLLLAIGALVPFEDGHAEIRSMHTVDEARGRGVGWAVLERLASIADERGCRRVSLETGTDKAFSPARRLYTRAGFKVCPPFGAYRSSPDSVCMTRRL